MTSRQETAAIEHKDSPRYPKVLCGPWWSSERLRPFDVWLLHPRRWRSPSVMPLPLSDTLTENASQSTVVMEQKRNVAPIFGKHISNNYEMGRDQWGKNHAQNWTFDFNSCRTSIQCIFNQLLWNIWWGKPRSSAVQLKKRNEYVDKLIKLEVIFIAVGNER